MSFAANEPHLSSLDETPVHAYRGVSVAAVIALVLGLASLLALAHPFLWILPVAAAATAIFAIRAIDAEGSTLTGRGLALTGLMLAVLFGVWAPARVVSRNWKMYQQARLFADEWIDLVRAGRRYEAYELTLRAADRQKPGVALERVYTDSADSQAGLARFLEDKPAKTLFALGDQARYRYVGGDGVRPREYLAEQVAVRYEVRYDSGGREQQLPLRIILSREEAEDRTFYWRVWGVTDPERGDP